MDRVTGFPRLQKADSQAPVPGVSLNQRLRTAEALVGRPAACKTPRTSPGPARPLGPRLGRANQKQHSTQERYTHISLTLSQVTQSRTERNKNKEVSESTAQAGAGPPWWEGRAGGRQVGRRPCRPEGVLLCPCASVYAGGQG